MLREAFRRVLIAQLFEPREMVAIERPHRADRQPDTMHRQRIAFSQSSKLRMRRSARAHVILGVNLDEPDRVCRRENVAKMRGLEADAGAGRQIRYTEHLQIPALRIAEMKEARGIRAPRIAQDLIGSSEPAPFGVLIVAQVPFTTYFQALPW